MSDLHNKIMNLRLDWQGEKPPTPDELLAYKIGQSAMRHAAAELVAEALSQQGEPDQPMQPASPDDMKVYQGIADNYHASRAPQQGEPVAWHVCSVNKDGSLSLEFAAQWREAAHEHINEAIDMDIDEAAQWVVRPVYAAPQQGEPAQQKPTSIRERWNIERDGADLLVCFNQHDKGEKCEYQRFVPAPRPAQQPAQQGEPGAWQQIKTAPRGKIVLVHYKNSMGNGRTMRATYFPADTLESDTTESGWADEGWYENSEAYEYLMQLDGEPTHWMPLPSAPGSAPHPAPAQQQGEAMPYEKFVAIREGHFNAASEEYFSARPQLDTNENRRIFYAGHCKGYDAAPAQQPLTDERIQDLLGIGNPTEEECRLIRLGWEAANGIGGEKP